MTRIKNLLKEDQASAVNTLLLAFSSDPFQRYLMPDSSIFLKIFLTIENLIPWSACWDQPPDTLNTKHLWVYSPQIL